MRVIVWNILPSLGIPVLFRNIDRRMTLSPGFSPIADHGEDDCFEQINVVRKIRVDSAMHNR